MTVIYVLFGILMFGVLIAVHELGHFSAAKLLGVKVNEFSIGMGPAIVQKQRGETVYSLRCIPIGGFCAMEGEDEETGDPRAFTSQKPWKRAVILVAGSFMNFVLGFLIVFFLFIDAAAFRAPVIVDFAEGCPYYSVDGFQKNDRILSIDGHKVYKYSDVSDFLSPSAETYDIVVKRDGKKVELKDFRLVPVEYKDGKRYGLYFGYDDATLGNKLYYSWGTTAEFSRWVWQGLKMLVEGDVKMDDLSGPVGIVDLMAETGENAASFTDGLLDILFLAAFIAVNLAIMNMLPIPAMDGGRVFFLIVTWIIESVTRKKLNPKYEGYIHAAGMVLLLGLMAVIMFNDIIKIAFK